MADVNIILNDANLRIARNVTPHYLDICRDSKVENVPSSRASQLLKVLHAALSHIAHAAQAFQAILKNLSVCQSPFVGAFCCLDYFSLINSMRAKEKP